MDVTLFGRDLEIRAGRAFLDGGPAQALVVQGPAGIGKTAVWRSLIEIARADGYLVLESIGDSAEARLTFVGLADLLGTVADAALPHLPAPQAHALEVALLRVEAASSPGEPRAVAVGVLSALRALAARGPVLVAIDDIPWLDGASADAIMFAARRLRGERVRFLLTRRPRTPTQLERALAPEVTHLNVGPLTLGAMRHMLADRLGLTLPRQLLGQIFESTLGNPLFALELGRTLVEQGLPAMGGDLPVPDTVEELLGARVTRQPRPVRRLLLAVALSGELGPPQLSAIAEPATVDDAIERGLVRVHGTRIRASHPLLAAAAKKRSGARERRELHRTLAAVASDEGLRAHHLALASREPEERLAASIAAAAGRAFTRGDRREAAELGEHAMLAEQQEHPWGLVTARRCGALIRLATPPYDEAAAAELEAAADSYGTLGLVFDRARTLLALGKAGRRLKQWAAARRSLERAAGTFDEIGSTGWAARARSEIDRIGARRPGRTDELTPTERRVVELAAAGRSNKEIARALFVTRNTVEGHLSHAYAKLGIHSRAQLAHRIGGGGVHEDSREP